MHWKDIKDVSFLSALHNSETVEVQGHREVKRKLLTVVEHIDKMEM
jgi:hypothetical protein